MIRPWGGPPPPGVAYVYAGGRGTDKIALHLAGLSGILQVDDYAAYKALARDHDLDTRDAHLTSPLCLRR